jgi:hypothetical protein
VTEPPLGPIRSYNSECLNRLKIANFRSLSTFPGALDAYHSIVSVKTLR